MIREYQGLKQVIKKGLLAAGNRRRLQNYASNTESICVDMKLKPGRKDSFILMFQRMCGSEEGVLATGRANP